MGFLKLTQPADMGHPAAPTYVNTELITLLQRGTDRTWVKTASGAVAVTETPEEILALLGQSGPLVIENLFTTVRDTLATQKILGTTEAERGELAIVISDAIRRAALTGGA